MIQSRLALSKTLKCKQCKAKLAPEAKGKFCGYGCINAFADAFAAAQVKRREVKARKEQRVQRNVIRAKIQATRSRAWHLKKAQAVFNKFIRARDASMPCISCNRHHTGSYDAGHYLSVGACPELRFDEANVHKQCVPCNQYKSGNVVLFRQALIGRIGIDALERLEGPHEPLKATIADCIAIVAKYQAKLKLI